MIHRDGAARDAEVVLLTVERVSLDRAAATPIGRVAAHAGQAADRTRGATRVAVRASTKGRATGLAADAVRPVPHPAAARALRRAGRARRPAAVRVGMANLAGGAAPAWGLAYQHSRRCERQA